MVRARSGALVSIAILLSTASLAASTAFGQADGRWAVSLGAGLTDPFAYRSHSYSFGDYRESFGLSGLALAGAAYRLADRASLRMDIGYMGYQKELQLVFATSTTIGMYSSRSTLTAQMPFVGAGVRLYAMGPASSRPRLYVEALPTLWVTRWRERVETRGHYDVYGNSYPSSVNQDAFKTLKPGFTAGAGFLGPLVGRTKLDVGMRYLFSTGAGRHNLGQFSTGDFKGLRQLALVMSVHRSL